MHINNFQVMSTEPGGDGLFPVKAIPPTGKAVKMRLSAGAIKDITDFGNKLKMAAANTAKKAKADAQKKDPK